MNSQRAIYLSSFTVSSPPLFPSLPFPSLPFLGPSPPPKWQSAEAASPAQEGRARAQTRRRVRTRRGRRTTTASVANQSCHLRPRVTYRTPHTARRISRYIPGVIGGALQAIYHTPGVTLLITSRTSHTGRHIPRVTSRNYISRVIPRPWYYRRFASPWCAESTSTVLSGKYKVCPNYAPERVRLRILPRKALLVWLNCDRGGSRNMSCRRE